MRQQLLHEYLHTVHVYMDYKTWMRMKKKDYTCLDVIITRTKMLLQ